MVDSGVSKRPADLPALVTVNVEPRSSSGLSVPALRRVGEPLHVGVELVERTRVAVPHDRDDEPLLGLHGDADVVAVEVDELVAVDARVQLRELLQRRRDRLQHERQEPLRVDAVKSHSSTQVTGGISRCARVRCSNICRLRRGSAPASSACRARGRGAAAPRTSSSVIRPCGPVPAIAASSTPSSCASRGRAASRAPCSSWLRRRLRSGRCRRAAGCAAPFAADHDEHRADGDDLALADEDLRDDAGGRRRDLDRRLVGRDLDERIVLGDLLALRDEPARDLALGQSLAEVGQLELVRHLRDPLQIAVVADDEPVGVELYVRLEAARAVADDASPSGS